jgi:hypothetical protein
MKRVLIVTLLIASLVALGPFRLFQADALNAEPHTPRSGSKAHSSAQAVSYTFTKIADTTGSFQDLGSEAINDNGVVAFAANLDAGGRAIVKGDGGSLTTIADFTTNVPGFGTFSGLGFDVSINSAGAVAFQGGFLSTNTGGVFTGSGGPITIVGPPPPNPNVGPNFREPFIINSGDVFMVGTATNLQGNSIYVSRGGGPPVLLYDPLRLPNVGGLFGGLSANRVGTAAFLTGIMSSTGGSFWYVFTGLGGPVTEIADPSVSVFPDYGGTSINSSGTVAFKSGRNFGTTTIYTGNGGPLTTVADNLGPYGILAPSGAAINDDGMVVFSASLDTNPGIPAGIFRGADPVADKIIGIGDPLDGSTIRMVSCGRKSLNNAGQIAFEATLANGIQGIFRADPVNPNSAPVARCQDVTVSPGPDCTAAASVDNGSSDPDGDSITITQSPPGPYPLGTTSVTLTVTDPLGASSQCTATVTVADTTPPTINSIPSNASYQCASQVPAGNPSQASATDNCSTPTLTMTETSNGGAGSPSSPLVISRTFTATDAAGNSTSATQTITVVDNESPAIICPANITVTANLGAGAAPVNYTPATATDNCSATTVQCIPPPGGNFAIGVTTVNCTARDAAANTASCAFTITVLTPQGATQRIVADVATLVSQGVLNPGLGNALISTLSTAILQMNAGNSVAATNVLRTFVLQANLFTLLGFLPPSDGQGLVTAANAVIARLGP